MATPIVRASPAIDSWPLWLQWYMRPFGEFTIFTLFPWAGFVFAGGAVGALIAAARDASARSGGCTSILGAIGVALVMLGFYTAGLPAIYASSSFWTSSPTWFAIRLGILMIALTAIYACEAAHAAVRGARRAGGAIDPLSRLGRSSLFIYWIHVELVYGYASWMWRHRLPLWGTAIALRPVLRADVSRHRLARPGGRQMAKPAAPVASCAAADRHRLIGRRISRGGIMNRRDFARLLAIGGAAPFLSPNVAWPRSLDLPPTPASPDEKFWMSVRDQFVMPKELTMLNAANLCPASGVGARDDVPADQGHGSGSVAGEPRQAGRRPREHAQAARRLPPRHARGDRHHPQHERVEQPRVDRHRSEGRRRGAAHRRQPSEQPHRVAGEGQAVRFHREGRADAQPASRDGVLRRRVRQGDHAADQGDLVHAPDQHGRRSVSGQGDSARWRASAAS